MLLTVVCVCVCVCMLNCLTFCDPVDCSSPGSSVHEISQARILGWIVISSSRGIVPTHRSHPHLLHWEQLLYHWATWEAHKQ